MLIQADAFHVPLTSGSVHTVVTSPPYWGLRKFSGEQGDEPLGLEATPERHIERTVLWAREVYRALRDDGVFWLNYGDTYGTGTTAGRTPGNRGIGANTQNAQDIDRHGGQARQLMLMPHRIALALQADGWIVRQDLVWSKRNPMPESTAGWSWQRHRIKVSKSEHAAKHDIRGGHKKMLEDASVHQGIDEDWIPKYVDCPGCEKCETNDNLILKRKSWRHTRAHEYIFMLVKGMQYWSNQEAVREGQSQATIDRFGGGTPRKMGKAYHPERNEAMQREQLSGRNPRSVLDVPTAPYKGAHYATFPPNLIAPLIRATCPRWACPVCGQGWAAAVEGRGYSKHRPSAGDDPRSRSEDKQALGSMGGHHGWRGNNLLKNRPDILGHRPTCDHEHTQEEAVPGIVLDPFVGSGTTVAVARELLRQGIGLDISRPYLDSQAKIRTKIGTPSGQFDNLPLFGIQGE